MFTKMMIIPLFLLASVRAAQVPQAASDEVLVRDTIANYLHGLKFNDVDNLRKAFLPEAKLYFVKKNGSLGQLTQEQWYEGFKESAGKEEQGNLSIAAVDLAGNVASVKVEEDYPNLRYTDYISLLKLNGEWKIVNKIFYATSKHR